MSILDSAKRISLGGLTLLIVLLATTALAQHAGDLGQAPPPPPGPGSLTVQLVGDANPDALTGISIALYALGPDGTPGLANGETDATGAFTFTGISNDPAIVYLVGARYAEIPFGERIAFDAGATNARIEIPVSQPTDVISGVSVSEIRTRVDWMGDRIVVTEILRLESTGERVIQVPALDSGPSILERTLPANAKDFNAGPTSIGDELALVDSRVRFYGPLYPGEQRIEYQFSVPVDRKTDAVRFPITLREASDRVIIVAGTSGMDVSGRGLVASRELTSDSGESLASWARPGLRAGESLEVGLVLPESRFDPTALTIPRTDVWVDLDDTRLDANVDLQIEVDPGAPISGTTAAPLLHITIPQGAALQGVAPEAEAMGLIPTEDGGFDVIGPIGPGAHSLAYSYRVGSRPDGVVLNMRFPREVETLNVLIADTGLALDSSRLHRRRPFRNRTRNYLHREAYNVGMEETVDLTLVPLRAEGLPQTASVGLALAGAAGAALFLIAPLRSRRSAIKVTDDATVRQQELQDQREGLYTAIADLDHDFETGKLDEADYTVMRDELKAQAAELMRIEYAEGGGVPTAPAPTPAVVATAPDAQAAGPFCTSCGERVDPRWRFCSHCGGGLEPTAEDAQG